MGNGENAKQSSILLSFHDYNVNNFILWTLKYRGISKYPIFPFPHIEAFWRLCSRRLFENIVTKEEIAQNKQCLLLPQCKSTALIVNTNEQNYYCNVSLIIQPNPILLVTQKNRLIETILLSTHTIGFADKIMILEQVKRS